MLKIVFIILMLAVLSLGVFFFPVVLFIPFFMAAILLTLSICLFFQDIVFKKNPLSLGVSDLLLKILYFSLIFTICSMPPKSISSYIFYIAVVIAGLFEILFFRFKRQDIALENQPYKTPWRYVKSAISPRKLKNQEDISEKKLKYFKSIYHFKITFIISIVSFIITSVGVSICENENIKILNFICLAIIAIISIIQAILTLMLIKSLKISYVYKIIISIIAFSAPILVFSAHIYLIDSTIGALFAVLGYVFYTISFFTTYLTAIYYDLNSIETE
ncbi:MAG: hypothetical protein E7678_03910 [Ruminococcaceae bacterium]|nr:hypothetical protein [Oscillospiraceae bacterium]